MAAPTISIPKICGNGACAKTKEETGGQLRCCSGCRAIAYCSVACQRAAWPHHSTVCKIISGQGRVLKKGAAVEPELEGKARLLKRLEGVKNAMRHGSAVGDVPPAAVDRMMRAAPDSVEALARETQDREIRASNQLIAAAQRSGNRPLMEAVGFAHLKLMLGKTERAYSHFPEGEKGEERRVLAEMRERIDHDHPTQEDIQRMFQDFDTLQKLTIALLQESIERKELIQELLEKMPGKGAPASQ